MPTQPPTDRAWIRATDWPPSVIWATGLYGGLVLWLSLSVLLHAAGLYPDPAAAGGPP